MSLMPPIWNVGKRCLVYCGDDRCNCDCNPRYRDMVRNPIHSSNAVGATSNDRGDSTIPVIEDPKQ